MRDPFRLRPLAVLTAVVVTLAGGATRGRADVLPEKRSRPRACTAPGQPCDRLGSKTDETGTCVAATCAKDLPARDGGTVTVKFDCLECAAAGSAKAASQPTAKSSGCSVAPERGGGGSLPLTGALLGALLLVARRRGARDGITGSARSRGARR